MKLKFIKSINESNILVSLTLTGMTANEKKAIRYLGAPIISLEKTYEVSGTSVLMEQAVNDFVGVETSFEGTVDNISEIMEEANTFINDVKDAVETEMIELMNTYKEIEKELEKQSGEFEIKDGEN